MDARAAPAKHRAPLTPATTEDRVRPGVPLSSYWHVVVLWTLIVATRPPPSPTHGASLGSQGSRRSGLGWAGQAQVVVRHPAEFPRAAWTQTEGIVNMEMHTNVLLVTANVGSLFENVSSLNSTAPRCTAAGGLRSKLGGFQRNIKYAGLKVGIAPERWAPAASLYVELERCNRARRRVLVSS